MNKKLLVMKIKFTILMNLARLFGNLSFKLPFKSLQIMRRAYNNVLGNEEFYINLLIPAILAYERFDTFLYSGATLKEIANANNLPKKIIPHLKYLLESAVVIGLLKKKDNKYFFKRRYEVSLSKATNYFVKHNKITSFNEHIELSRLKIVESIVSGFKDSTSYIDESFSAEFFSSLRNIALMLIADNKRKYKYVMDIGPGTGYSILFLDKWLNPDVIYAVDNNPKILNYAKRKLSLFNRTNINKIKFITRDITAEDFPSNLESVDLIFSAYTLRYISPESYQKFAINISKILKKNGLFLAVDSFRRNEKNMVPFHLNLEYIEPKIIMPVYSKLRRALINAGFSDVTIFFKGKYKEIYRVLAAVK